MKHWVVSSKHSRDPGTKGWNSKWTADNYFRKKKFYPSKRHEDFSEGDFCIVKVFTAQIFIGDFRIASKLQKDKEGNIWYKIDQINEWDFHLHEHNLPQKYRDSLSRSPSTDISEKYYYELLGIKKFNKNLRMNYKNRLTLKVSEKEIEKLLDSKNALKEKGLEIIERQLELTDGNILDLLCSDQNGDLVVVELKKKSPNETIGQLARYVTDVREHRASSSQKVKGLILAFDVDEQLIKAARGVDFDVMLYQIKIA